jgi:methyltransferase (TIGR00027 family)
MARPMLLATHNGDEIVWHLGRRIALRRAMKARLAGAWLAGASLLAASLALAVEPGQVSRTALSACALRAIGAQDPDPKTRNPDYLAEKFLGRKINFALEIQAIIQRPRRSFFFITARTKHIDAILEEEIKRGVGQVVILGAGLDSRGLRFHQRFPKVKFFELDLPATQKYKRGLVAKVVGKPPATLVFAPIDFNTQTLGEVLQAAGYDKTARTFFIWEGVTYYISAQAVDGTLRFIAAKSAPGSSVVFDYALEEIIKGDFRRFPTARWGMQWFASMGEPWVFGIADGQAASYVAQRGLKALSDLDSRELTKRYLMTSQGKVYGPLSGMIRIIHAEVPKP